MPTFVKWSQTKQTHHGRPSGHFSPLAHSLWISFLGIDPLAWARSGAACTPRSTFISPCWRKCRTEELCAILLASIEGAFHGIHMSYDKMHVEKDWGFLPVNPINAVNNLNCILRCRFKSPLSHVSVSSKNTAEI